MIGLALMIIIIIFNFTYGFKNIRNCFFIDYFLLLLFPVGDIGKIYTGHIFNIHMYLQYKSMDIFDITILSITLITLTRVILNNTGFKRINLFDGLIIILGTIFVIYILIGYLNIEKLAISDGKKYILFILLYFTGREILDKEDISKFIKVTLYSAFFNSILLIIIYFFTINNYINVGDRYSFGCESIYVITIPLQLYFIFNKNKELLQFNKSFLIISICIQSILLLLAQNRTNPLMIIASVILIYIFNLLINKINIKEFYIKIAKLIFASILFVSIFISIILVLSHFNVAIIDRYTGKDNSNGANYTYEIRKTTNNYYLDELKKNLFGYGLGTNMFNILPDGGLDASSLESFQIDNMPIVMGYKFGIIGIIIYLLIIVYNFKNLKLKAKNNKSVYLPMLAILPFFLISCGYMTSQVIHNVCIRSYWWVYLAITRNRS
jgi:hypothetical protein